MRRPNWMRRNELRREGESLAEAYTPSVERSEQYKRMCACGHPCGDHMFGADECEPGYVPGQGIVKCECKKFEEKKEVAA